jgi:hypothetical protein
MTGLLVGLGCFLFHVAVSLVWLRRPGRTSPVARHAASALGTHAIGVFLAALWVGPFAYWSAAAMSGFGAVVWLFGYSAVYKSVSLSILRELSRSPGQVVPIETIVDRYVRPEFENRAQVLVRMGCARETERGYEVTRRGIDISTRLAVVQWMFGITASGLYNEAD